MQYLIKVWKVKKKIYKNYKNKLNHSLQIAKGLYYEKKLNNIQSNTRATCKVLHDILNRSKRNSNRCSTFKADDREITDPVEIANKVCSYFSSISPNLARGIQSSASHPSFLNGSFTQSIFFNTTTKMRSLKLWKFFFSAKQLTTTRFQWQSLRSPFYLFLNHSPIS